MKRKKDIPDVNNESSSEEENTGLFEVIANGNINQVKSWLEQEKNAGINDKSDGITPLCSAAKNGEEEIVELLLNNGAKINLPCDDGNTALQLAIEESHKEIAIFLIKEGADVNVQNKEGKTALHLTIEKNSDEEIVTLLLQYGADINIRYDENIPLCYAASKNRKKLVLLLVKQYKNSTQLTSKDKKVLQKWMKKQLSDTNCQLKALIEAKNEESQKTNLLDDSKIFPSTSNSSPASSVLAKTSLSSETHKNIAVGLETSIHGDVFQLKLLLLFIIRGKFYYPEFRLYTELPEAEKFDDLIFAYKPSDSKTLTYRFIQAKHRLHTQEKKIKLRELESKDGPFALSKYCESVYNILNKEQIFKDCEFEDFILITNADLENGWEECFIEINKDDKILDFNEAGKKLKLKNTEDVNNILRKEKRKTRSSAHSECKKLKDEEDKKIEDFIEKFIFIINYPSEEKLGELITDELVTEEPSLSSDKLNTIKCKMLYNSSQSNTLNWFKSIESRCIYFKDKTLYKVPKKFSNVTDKIEPEPEWILEDFFVKVYEFIYHGLNKIRFAKFTDTKVSFIPENTTSLTNFLSQDGKQVFHLITNNLTIISAIRIYQLLKEEDNIFFIKISELVPAETLNFVIDNFSVLVINCENQDELIIEHLYKKFIKVLDNSKNKKIILIGPSENILGDKFKNTLAGKFKINSKKYISEKDETSFKDLDDDSQDRLLKEVVVNLQKGMFFDECFSNSENYQLMLYDLIDITSASQIIDLTLLPYLVECLSNKSSLAIGNANAFSFDSYTSGCYIQRGLHRQKIKCDILNNVTDLSLLFITGASKQHLIDLGAKQNEISIWSNDNLENNFIILPSSEHNNQEYENIFQKLCNNYNKKNVHWIEYQHGELLWVRSKGFTTLALENYVDENNSVDKNIIKETHFSVPSTNEKNIILANNAGTGKSMTMTSVAIKMKQNDPTLWVVRINLNDHAENGQETSLGQINNQKWIEDETIEFISKMVVPGDCKHSYVQLQRKLFQACLKNPQKVKIVSIFDGFDEICPFYKEKITFLLKVLKTSQIKQQWITTRTHEKNFLENQLESAAYILVPFTKTEQREYVDIFWKKELKSCMNENNHERNEKFYQEIFKQLENAKSSLTSLNDSLSAECIKKLYDLISDILKGYAKEQVDFKYLQENIEVLNFCDYAEVLLMRWRESIRDKKSEFTIPPLHLRMLAVVVFEKKFQLPEILGLLNLYDEFVNVIFNIYYREKSKTKEGNEARSRQNHSDLNLLHRIHYELALRLIFPEESELPGLDEFRHFKEEQEEIDKNAEEELVRCGLLKGNPLTFNHRSFAEYFVSKYLINYLDKILVQKLLLRKILYEYDYALIRQFFDAQIEKERTKSQKIELHITAVESIDNFLKDRHSFADTFLHIVIREGHAAIVKFIFDKFDKHIKTDTLKNIMLVTAEYERTILHEAFEGPNNKIIEILLQNLTKYSEVFKCILACSGNKKRNLLHWVAFKNNHDAIQMLFNSINNEEYSDVFDKLILDYDDFRQNALMLAAHNGRITRQSKTFEILLNGILDNNYSKIFVNASQKYIVHILRDGISLCNAAIVKKLLMKIKEIFPDKLNEIFTMADDYGQTVCHSVTENTNDNVVELLFDWIEETFKENASVILQNFLKPDFSGETPFYIIYVQKRSNIIEYMLDKTHNIHPEIHENMLQIKMSLDIYQNTQISKDIQQSFSNALKQNDKDLVQSILNDINDIDKKAVLLLNTKGGSSALILAIDNNNIECVQLLLENISENFKRFFFEEIILEIIDQMDGSNILHWLAKNGHTETITYLLNKINGNDYLHIYKDLVLHKNYYKQTSLHIAVLNDRIEVVKTVLHSVAKHPSNILKDLILATDDYKQTALILASKKEQSNQEIINILQSYSDRIASTLVVTNIAGPSNTNSLPSNIS